MTVELEIGKSSKVNAGDGLSYHGLVVPAMNDELAAGDNGCDSDMDDSPPPHRHRAAVFRLFQPNPFCPRNLIASQLIQSGIIRNGDVELLLVNQPQQTPAVQTTLIPTSPPIRKPDVFRGPMHSFSSKCWKAFSRIEL